MLELIKALLRLKLVDLTGRMLVSPPLPERSIDPNTLEPLRSNRTTSPGSLDDLWSYHQSSHHHQPPNSSTHQIEPSSQLTWTGKRTGLVRPSIAILRSPQYPNTDPMAESGRNLINEYLSRKALTLEEVLKPLDLVRKSKTNKARLAEIIWILRPVIYVLLINRFGSRHAIPFLSSSSLEYLSYSLRKSSFRDPKRPSSASKTPPSYFSVSPRRSAFQSFVSELERNELDQRKKALWSYLLRGPLWFLWTKPKLIALSAKLESIPLLNLLSTMIHDYTPLLDEYHYYVN